MSTRLRVEIPGEPVAKGRPRTRVSPLASAESRFWHRVDRGSGDGCWVWVGSKTMAGYGRLKVNGKQTYAHRYSFFLANGSVVGDGMCILHRCDNPPCVNPSHLFLGTRGDNVRDAASKGRLWAQKRPHDLPRGEDHQWSKLTEESVRHIRAVVASGGSQRAMARLYGVDRVAVRNVVSRKTWRHVE